MKIQLFLVQYASPGVTYVSTGKLNDLQRLAGHFMRAGPRLNCAKRGYFLLHVKTGKNKGTYIPLTASVSNHGIEPSTSRNEQMDIFISVLTMKSKMKPLRYRELFGH